MSPMRKRYMIRLVLRCLVLALCGTLWAAAPEEFDVLTGMGFFRRISPLHLLWVVWVVDMVQQILPIKSKIALGSRKLFACCFRPPQEKVRDEALKSYISTTTKAAYKVFALWWLLIALIGALYFFGVIDRIGLFMITLVFYVCDLICVLIWCPFRLMMKTRCCTTCRIFNWDHLMMFSPLIFMGGFYGISLVALAVLAWLVWEWSILMHPERFWDKSNVALKCAQCTDKLCTQYCGKGKK